ncbi:MAG: MlaD family protein [Pseudomonadota bacterium]|nr:MlaD family protein [Pseudomonadota bacterium]
MSQKASPTAIGAFVLGAVALIITGLLTFGSGKFLKDLDNKVLFFQGNTRGLNIGAPVSFRGVKIGSVKNIQLVYDVSTDEAFVEVLVEIEGDAFHDVESQPGVDRSAGKDVLTYLIDELGLRAKLANLSLVTGQLYIELDFFPDTEAKLYGFNSKHDEFPTLPSTIEELENVLRTVVENLKELPVRELIDRLASAMEGINSLINAQATRDAPEVLHQALVNLRDLTGKLNEQVTPLTNSLTQTSAEASAAFADVRQVMRDERGEIVRLAESVERAAKQARGVLKQTEGVVSAVDNVAIARLVQELSRAATSIRVFADYLDRHPEALIRGKNR